MPITVQLPEGMLSRDEEETVVVGLTDAILDINGATANPFVRKNLIVAVTTVAPDRLYADGRREPWANVTLRVPPFSLETPEQRRAFVGRMTDVLDSVTGDRLARDRIYINMVWGDGFWAIGGETYSNEELRQTAMAAAV